MLKDKAGQDPVAPGNHVFKGRAAEHPAGMLCHNTNESIRLVAPPACEPLLRLAARCGPGLHIGGAHLGGQDRALTHHGHAVSSTADQQEAKPARL